MTLSIIITNHCDHAECAATIASIRATAPATLQVIVVDDASRVVFTHPNSGVEITRTDRRIGVGPARHLGALKASGDLLMFTDAHMRFVPGWYEALMLKAENRPTTLHCGHCLLLNKQHMDLSRHQGDFWGATWNFYGPDRNNRLVKQIFETIWAEEQPGDDYEIAAVMGACYFIPREFYLKLDPLRHLHSWGGDEAALSLKTWLTGGDVRLLKQVRVGHRFRDNERLPFHLSSADTIYNKLFLIHTCLTPSFATPLLAKFRKDGDYHKAMKRIEEDWPLVICEQARNARLFTRTFQWYLDRFGLSFPLD